MSETHIAIIPARAASKTIPNKNLQKVGGLNLVERAIDVCCEAKFFSEVILTTDIPYFIESECRATVRPRNSDLCTDDALMWDVIKDVIGFAELRPHHFLWLIQPTSPFREVGHFNQVRHLIQESPDCSLISVSHVGAFHPDRMYTVKNNCLHWMNKPMRWENKQSLSPIYIRNGAFYVSSVGRLLQYESFDRPRCIPFFMFDKSAINIDSGYDLILAKALANG